MVRLVMALFNHPGYNDEIIFLPGGVGEGLGDGQAGLDGIGAETIFQVGFAEERNAGDVDFGELADVTEHVAELFLEGRDLLG